ncbi:MAG: hypothetical protein LCH70_07615 [Proteobacteria bacterium]|nr:hypothetical protein [Pseudomonadota bacterium]
MDDGELDRFDRHFRVSEKMKKALPHIIESEHDLLFSALGAALCFHELSDIVDRLAHGDPDQINIDDIADDLRYTRVGFELALRALDEQIKGRGHSFDLRKKGAVARWKNDPKAQAREEIRQIWEQSGKPRGTPFARRMLIEHPDAYTNERSLAQAIERWLKQESSS